MYKRQAEIAPKVLGWAQRAAGRRERGLSSGHVERVPPSCPEALAFGVPMWREEEAQLVADCLLRFLRLQREHLGKQHLSTLATGALLCCALAQDASLDRRKTGVEGLERIVARLGELLGESHPLTLGAKKKLAFAAWENGEINDAPKPTQVLREVLQREELLYGAQHPIPLATGEALERIRTTVTSEELPSDQSSNASMPSVD